MNVKKQSYCKKKKKKTKKKSLAQKQYLQNHTISKERDGVTKTNQKKETHFEFTMKCSKTCLHELY